MEPSLPSAVKPTSSESRLAGEVVALITARGGSKGLPRKNVLDLGGKPLIAWTIEAARSACLVDRVVLSSDDPEIIAVASQFGCEVPFVRPIELATDAASSIDVVLDALDRLPACRTVILLQPTSPMRTAQDIDAAVQCMRANDAPACVSVTEAEASPYWMFRLEPPQGRLTPLLESAASSRRQDLPKVYNLNGAVYVARTDWLREKRTFLASETVAYVMPNSRSHDIDTLEDLEYLRWQLQQKFGAVN